jgi:hypothetical protein
MGGASGAVAPEQQSAARDSRGDGRLLHAATGGAGAEPAKHGEGGQVGEASSPLWRCVRIIRRNETLAVCRVHGHSERERARRQPALPAGTQCRTDV